MWLRERVFHFCLFILYSSYWSALILLQGSKYNNFRPLCFFQRWWDVIVLMSSKQRDPDEDVVTRIFLCWKTAFFTVGDLSLQCPSAQGKWKTRGDVALPFLPSTPPFPHVGGGWGLVYHASYGCHRTAWPYTSPHSPQFGDHVLGSSGKLGTRSQLKT